MGQVINLQDWRRDHSAEAAKTAEWSRAWRVPETFSAEPLLLSSLTVWQVAVVMWAGMVLAASAGIGTPKAERRPSAPVPAANPLVGRRP